ncbi:hypothetical protein CHS0354_012843 [Potamilus streckersoni]|uniref:Uncharacterized protein n=1 Tax=Potamilus streckersoni TaxID=2493646 RepID=A0AAE0W314_9BIVA|nr:hypothetical protein CHS0354_012843 [Potamilus streckersoni]
MGQIQNADIPFNSSNSGQLQTPVRIPISDLVDYVAEVIMDTSSEVIMDISAEVIMDTSSEVIMDISAESLS